MVVLVSGGSGFVGGAVVAELISSGHRVVTTTTNLSSKLPKAPKLSWVMWEGTKEALPHIDWSKINVILHLAVPRNVFAFPDQARPNFELSVAATFRLLETAYDKGVRRVIVATTSEGLASEDNVTYMPNSFYGTAKACAELLVRSYQSLLSTAILRFYHPYGPGGDLFLVNRLLSLVAQGQEIAVIGEDGIMLNPVWIDDLALGVRLAVESNETGIFHFAGPQTLTIRQLLEIIGKLVNRKPIIRTATGSCLQRHAAAFERSHRLLGYNPRISIGEGLRRLLKSYTVFPG
jgi:UDP-glucose 4-epimerase